MTDNYTKTTEKHREALRHFMRERGLNNLSWQKKSGVNEATIRHFLNKGATMTHRILEKLAASENVTVAEMLGEDKFAAHETSADRNVSSETLEMILREILEQDIDLPFDEKIEAIIHLYELVREDHDADVHQQASSILKFIVRRKDKEK